MRVKISDVIEATAAYYCLDKIALCGPSRQRRVAMARHVAVYLARSFAEVVYPYYRGATHPSLSSIGAKLGGRDHTTVMHSIWRAGELLRTSDRARRDIETIARCLTDGKSEAAVFAIGAAARTTDRARGIDPLGYSQKAHGRKTPLIAHRYAFIETMRSRRPARMERRGAGHA